ncbi:MAG: hemolysin III family protein [Bacteroides sp.]|nr:hemolysin III family protein [Bacteroides sp.]
MDITNKFSKGEELANAYSHLFGALLAMLGLVLMLNQSMVHGDALHIITCSVFGATMVILYFSSTMTHILPMGRTKDIFFNMDRIAIYLLIAGTYTPIALLAIGGPLGWVVFGIEWGIALTGTLMILFKPGDYDTGVNTFYVVSYAVMGWLFLVVAIFPGNLDIPQMAWIWILIGGVFYSVGIAFFKIFKCPYHHLVWHILVIAGSLSHFIAIFFYLIPR